MSRTPFPHILNSKIDSKSNLLRIATDQEDVSGNVIVHFEGVQGNPKTGQMEEVYNIWVFSEIHEKRPARGDWSNWPKWPTYFAGVGTLLQRTFLKNLSPEYKALIPKAG